MSAPEYTMIGSVLAVGLVLIVSWWLAGLVRRRAASFGALDVPNQRSSHALPTPRGGGVAIVVTTTVALMILAWLGHLPLRLLAVIGVGGVVVAGVGLLDDTVKVTARARFAVHLIAAVWAVALSGGLPAVQVGEAVVSLGWFGDLLAVLAIAWSLNLFNFMDGIDGIAASEAIFIVLGGALLVLLDGSATAVPAISAVIASACAGFLLWNWPPAKLFMGDVGSGYLGYVIAVLALASARTDPVAILAWITLGGVFFIDATVTLVCRLIRRERVYEAHRSHAYQRLARRWKSHKRVIVVVTLINVVWLLPAALLESLYPNRAVWIAAAALLPLLLAALFAGAGRADSLADGRLANAG